MKYVALLIALLLVACAGPDGGETNINIADQGSQSGDPITETEANSGCADSEDQCGADF